jgi:hypothetical protein
MEAVGGEAECRKAEVFEDVSCLRRRNGGAMNSMVTRKNTRCGAEKIARRSARARGPAPVVQLGQLAGEKDGEELHTAGEKDREELDTQRANAIQAQIHQQLRWLSWATAPGRQRFSQLPWCG